MSKAESLYPLTFFRSSKRRPRILVYLVVWAFVAATALIYLGCSGDSSTNPKTDPVNRLAGGGRSDNSDPFIGGARDCGPNDSLGGLPGSDPYTKYTVLFYTYLSCDITGGPALIDNQSDWEDWWDSAVACMAYVGFSPLGDSGDFPPDSSNDSGWVPGDTIPPFRDPPQVDFDKYAVAVIVEESPNYGESVWLQDVTVASSGTALHYDVMIPGDDCYFMMGDSTGDSLVNPTPYITAAFLVEKPIIEPVGWIRTETIYNCTWQPDPKEPLMLYYTDAPCELGDGEEIITNKEDFEDWTATAFACDWQRWQYNDTIYYPWKDSGGVIDSGGSGYPNIPPIPTFDIDFTTHAVIILRAGEQTKWGGGLWLTGFKVTDNGTTIEYYVMEPGSNCPDIGEGEVIRPTVAIRVPLPLSGPIQWLKKIEPITCDWGNDTTWVDGGGGR